MNPPSALVAAISAVIRTKISAHILVCDEDSNSRATKRETPTVKAHINNKEITIRLIGLLLFEGSSDFHFYPEANFWEDNGFSKIRIAI